MGLIHCLLRCAHPPSVIVLAGNRTRKHIMAKPNYQFEKRQRELAKKKKKEEKALRKAAPPASAEPPKEEGAPRA